jgi:putative hemolysin
VHQLMVPRRQIASLDLNASLAQQLAEIDASPFTRLVVHRGGFDDVYGFLHLKDVALAVADGHDFRSLKPLVRPLLALPSGLTTDRALGQMRDRHARIALLVDEFGDVEGLISLEDIIRELLGELSDEFKSCSDLAPMALPDGCWRLPGRLPLDEAIEWAQTLGTPDWGTSKAETLAGWLIEQIDAIPEVGRRFTAAGIDFEIECMDGAAINSVLARLPPLTSGDGDV